VSLRIDRSSGATRARLCVGWKAGQGAKISNSSKRFLREVCRPPLTRIIYTGVGDRTRLSVARKRIRNVRLVLLSCRSLTSTACVLIAFLGSHETHRLPL